MGKQHTGQESDGTAGIRKSKIARCGTACSPGAAPRLGRLSHLAPGQFESARQWLIERIAERAVEIMQEAEAK